MVSLPSLFLAHGAPDLPISDHPASQFLKGLAKQIDRPRSILIVSAHWEAPVASVSVHPTPETVYDFGGFPPELYTLKYPAKNDPALAQRALELLDQAGFQTESHPERGYDHGVWVPLLLSYGGADIPVTQVSLIRHGSPRDHFNMGKALAPLRAESVLIVGSGAVVHNLRHLAPEGTQPMPWASDFEIWFKRAIAARDLDNLMGVPATPNSARTAHPTLEHLLPIFVAMGAGWQGGDSELLHDSFSYGSISMASYAFGSGDELATLRGERVAA